jgi:hypothetical protein
VHERSGDAVHERSGDAVHVQTKVHSMEMWVLVRVLIRMRCVLVTMAREGAAVMR